MTSRYAVEIAMVAADPDVPRAEIEVLGFAVLDELLDAPGVLDADLLADFSKASLTFTFSVDAPDNPSALADASEAFHAAVERISKTPPRVFLTAGTREAVLV